VRRRTRGEIVASVLFTLLMAACGAFAFWLDSFAGGGAHGLWGAIGAGIGGRFGHLLFAVEHERGEL
jgi:hypothetical protein